MSQAPGLAVGWGYQGPGLRARFPTCLSWGIYYFGGGLKLPIEAGLGPGLGFEARLKSKTSLDGALGRGEQGEMR